MGKLLQSKEFITLLIFFLLASYLLIADTCNGDSKVNDRATSDSVVKRTKITMAGCVIEMEKVRVTKYANNSLIPDTEYVKGYKGLYYLIDLKDTASQKILLFPPGEYYYKGFERKLIDALNFVWSTIIDSSLKGVTCKIFVEGEADIAGQTTFSSKFTPGYIYDSITYHPTFASTGRAHYFYSSESKVKKFHEPLSNNDLPLLRAAYLTDKLKVNMHIPDPVVLEGSVNQNKGEIYRNGKIILFIDTNSSGNKNN